MIKAYFFDWMKTLGDFTPSNLGDIPKLVTKEQERLLLIKKFENVPLNNKDVVYSSLLETNLFIYPDSEEVISNLKSKYKLAIISDMYDVTVQRIRKLFPKFLNNFDVLTFSSEVGIKKPDPEIFLYTCNKLNICPQDVIMIGDNQDKDIDPAFALGMQARLINREKQTLEDVI